MAAKDELAELLQFLAADNAQLRVQAAEIVQGLTGSDSGAAELVDRADEVVPPLLRLVSRPGQEALLAATCLTNLTAHHRAAEAALRHGAVDLGAPHLFSCSGFQGVTELFTPAAAAADLACEPTSVRALEVIHSVECKARVRSLLLMVVSNLTTHAEGTAQLLKLGRGQLEGFHLWHLLQLLSVDAEENAHAGGVLANATAQPPGRALLLRGGADTAQVLARVLLSRTAPLPAREGAAVALRNLAIDPATRSALLLAKEAVVAALLLPLRPPHAACDAALREACADGVASFAADDDGRKALWAAGAVELLQRCYDEEKEPDVCAALESAVRASFGGCRHRSASLTRLHRTRRSTWSAPAARSRV